MIRRHFLGTVLGYAASTGLPWIAERVNRKVSDFQVAIQLPGGLLIKAPPIHLLILDERRGNRLHLSRIRYEDRGIPNLLTKSWLIFLPSKEEAKIGSVGTGNDGTGILLRLPNLSDAVMADLQRVAEETVRRTYDPENRFRWTEHAL